MAYNKASFNFLKIEKFYPCKFGQTVKISRKNDFALPRFPQLYQIDILIAYFMHP